MLDQALIAAGAWRDAGFDLPVSVNVSPRSLLDARFPARCWPGCAPTTCRRTGWCWS